MHLFQQLDSVHVKWDVYICKPDPKFNSIS